MGIGVGVVLLVIGLILATNIIHWPHGVTNVISTHGLDVLGWILIIVGVVAILLVLIMNHQRTRTTHVEERRGDVPPTRDGY